MRTVSTKVPNDVYEELRRKAASEGLTVSAVLRRLIREYVGRPQVDQKVDPNLATKEEVDELRRRIDEIEKELRRIAGISYFMNRKKR